jgi:hypothetical protein
MKLYTEEEILSFLKKEFADEINAETFIENLTPIQLPSDEELEKNGYYDKELDDIFREGAKYVIDKIQGGNK